MEAVELVEEFYDDNYDDTWSGAEISLPETLNNTALKILMAQFNQIQSNGKFGQFSLGAPVNGPAAAPNNQSQECRDILVRCDEKPLWEALMGYGFLVVFCFALIGNCLNLLIYKSDQIRFFIAIRMLCTKLLMNTLMMVVMLPQALRVIRLWEIGGPSDQLYWQFWPYQAYLTNVFGFCAMWLTVLMTAECYIHIFFPSKSKMLCTKETVWRSYVIILFAALVLASIYPLNRTVSLTTKCDTTIVKINTSQNPVMTFFEKVHTLADLFLSILMPLTLLVFMTVMIVWRLWVWPNRHRRRLLANENKANSQNGHTPATSLLSTAAHHERKSRDHFAAEKRGVTRITLITCFIQLVTETPSMSVLIYVSMYGVNVHKEEYICTWQTVSYFLCLCNASLSFFVYITFSTRFRKTMIHRANVILHRLLPSVFPEVPEGPPGFKPKWSHQQMANQNSSVTHSQMVALTSKNNSPRNGSQCQGNAKMLMVTSAEGGGLGAGGKRASSITMLKEQQTGNALSSKKSSDDSTAADEVGMMQMPEFAGHFSLAKRYLQQKLSNNRGAKPTAAFFIPEGDNLTETTNSLETIPPLSAGGMAALNAKNSDASTRPWSNSVNNGEMQNARKQSALTKRSSVCSTATNSQCDAFL